ncbi:citrinin biosynthesis oxidoreductase [Trichoderma arundinaceum]|uniref:Citrinin biosynthesis oxidoreductase n=1 Tax=Trichoderma arundinaceum TaxID=490622 RepID=A0A395NFQ0_TRIAR|nr:citrinin biosynthesis oxidoreductase [Trichoderma arundinaceum]
MNGDSSNLALPRILCLHGAGVNAQVFRIQCRAIIARLKDKFRFVFADAFLEAQAHEMVIAVFGEFAPFYRWLGYKPEHPEIDSTIASQKIVRQITTAMEEDEGTGEWVGLLGFSQGGLISSSLLWAQEHIVEEDKKPLPGVNFRFAVIIASPGPIVQIDRTGTLPKPRHLPSAGERVSPFTDWPEEGATDDQNHLVTTPTLHVHGLQDPDLHNHRRLYKLYSKQGTAKLLEWDGGHRLPIKSEDVERVTNKMIELAEETGVEAF